MAWVDPSLRVKASIGTGKGHFSRAVVLARGLRPAVSIAADGTALVVWNAHHELWYSRARRGHHFAKPALLTPAGSKIGDDFAKTAGQPDGSTVIAYQSPYRNPQGRYVTRLRAVTVSRAGTAGPITELGVGVMDHDSFRASANGHAAVCCLNLAGPIEAPAEGVAAYAPGRAWATWVAPLAAQQRIETVSPGHGDVAVGVIDARENGDFVTLGVPGVLRADSSGVFGGLLQAPVVEQTRGFGPVVAIDGSGRNVLIYQEKRTPQSQSVSPLGPVYAVAAASDASFASRQVLATAEAFHPTVRPYGDGAIAAWEAPHHRWGVAVERGGTFTLAAAPASGPGGIGEDFSYNRDLATAGRYAVLIWTAADGTIRVSVGVL